MLNVDTFQKVKDDIDSARQRIARAEGGLAELLKRLKKNFGCSSVKEARAKLEKLELEIESKTKLFNKRLVKLEAKWKQSN